MPWNVLMQTLALTNSGESWQLSCLQKECLLKPKYSPNMGRFAL